MTGWPLADPPSVHEHQIGLEGLPDLPVRVLLELARRLDAALDHARAHPDTGGALVLRCVPPDAFTATPRLDTFRPDQVDALAERKNPRPSVRGCARYLSICVRTAIPAWLKSLIVSNAALSVAFLWLWRDYFQRCRDERGRRNFRDASIPRRARVMGEGADGHIGGYAVLPARAGLPVARCLVRQRPLCVSVSALRPPALARGRVRPVCSAPWCTCDLCANAPGRGRPKSRRGEAG